MISITYDNVWYGPPGACGVGNSFDVKVTLACGDPISTGTSYQYECGGGGGGEVTAYPNLANRELSVELIFPDTEAVTSQASSLSSIDNTLDVKLHNAMQQIVKTGSIVEGKLTGDVQDLPKGTYYLQVDAKKEIIRKQVRISN